MPKHIKPFFLQAWFLFKMRRKHHYNNSISSKLNLVLIFKPIDHGSFYIGNYCNFEKIFLKSLSEKHRDF